MKPHSCATSPPNWRLNQRKCQSPRVADFEANTLKEGAPSKLRFGGSFRRKIPAHLHCLPITDEGEVQARYSPHALGSKALPGDNKALPGNRPTPLPNLQLLPQTAEAERRGILRHVRSRAGANPTAARTASLRIRADARTRPPESSYAWVGSTARKLAVEQLSSLRNR